jgi:tetratricopeptide (TPR) repeat protein
MKRALPRINEGNFLVEAVKRHQAGDLAGARDLYRAILTQNPKHADAIFRIGTIALQVNQYDKAADFIRQAIKIGPVTGAMLINLGAALRGLEEYKSAIRAYDRAIKLNVNLADAYYNKGRALQSLKKFEEAKDSYKLSLSINDKEADTWINLGTVQRELGETDDALYAFEVAMRLNPLMGAGYSNAAAIFFDRALFEKSMDMMDKAIELEPENYDYREKLGFFLRSFGNLERGWIDFDIRFLAHKEAKATRRIEPPPYWNDEDLSNRKILLWTEQGLGEEVFSAGIIPDLLETGAQCVIECSERMQPLLQRSFPSIKVTSWLDNRETVKQASPPFEFQYPALSMVRTFRPTVDSITNHVPYIRADPKLVLDLRTKYEELAQGKRIIGISWRSKNPELGKDKTVPIMGWRPILEAEDVFYVNVQYGECTEEIAEVKSKLGVDIFVDPDVDALGDLDIVIAQIAATDLIISASNSNVHFAGAMGTPAWSMLPKSRGLVWYWFMDRSDSPWYPSVRLFRQQSAPSQDHSWWPEVINDVAAALPQWLSAPLAPRP